MTDEWEVWAGGALGILALWWYFFRSTAGRTTNPYTASISQEEARSMFASQVSRWHAEAAQAERLTHRHPEMNAVPADIILSTVLHESSGNPTAQHAGNEHGLGGFTPTATRDVRENITSDMAEGLVEIRSALDGTDDPARWTHAQEVAAIALYLGLLKRRHGTWIGALEAYRCGPDRTAPSGDCTAEAVARLRSAGRRQ